MCLKSEEQPGERSSDQVQALKDVEDMSEDERHARDVCGFTPFIAVSVTDTPSMNIGARVLFFPS